MSETITFPAKFNGGVGYAQGGYVAGKLSGLLDGPAYTTFRAPTPLETPLTIKREQGGVQIHTSEGVLTAQAVSKAIEIMAPPCPDRDAVVVARPGYRGYDDEGGNTCFVCSPHREPGECMQVHAAPVSDAVVACLWQPEDKYAEDGIVRPEFVWSVLDCPSGFGAMINFSKEQGPAMTGGLGAKLIHPISINEEYIAMGWHIASDGRKHSAGSAIYSAGGKLMAIAESLWIELRQPSVS